MVSISVVLDSNNCSLKLLVRFNFFLASKVTREKIVPRYKNQNVNGFHWVFPQGHHSQLGAQLTELCRYQALCPLFGFSLIFTEFLRKGHSFPPYFADNCRISNCPGLGFSS